MSTILVKKEQIKPHSIPRDENHIRITIPESIADACGFFQEKEMTLEQRIGRYGPFIVIYSEKSQKEWLKKNKGMSIESN